MNKKDNIVIIIVAVLMLAIVIYFPKFIKNKNNRDYYDSSLDKISNKTNYQANEIIPVYVNDQQMSRIYYKDFVNSVLSDVNSTYNLIDEDYRKKRFGDIYKYKDYINSLNLSISSDVKRYATYERPGYKYYDIYDKEGNRIIFKTKGVLQYKVLFDDIDKGED